MARVKHKSIQKMISEERSKVTDRQFFQSRLLAGHFEDIAAAQSRRYKSKSRVRVQVVWRPKEPLTAETNDLSILINAGNPIVTRQKTRQARYEMVSAFFSHELGHVLFTDFLQLQSYRNHLTGGNWYPAAPQCVSSADKLNAREIKDYLSTEPRHRGLFASMALFLHNCIEDGYIEDQMLRRYPGKLGYTLEQMRSYTYSEMPTVSDREDMEESSEEIWLTILQLILSYAKFGEIKYGTATVANPRVAALFDILDIIDGAMQASDMRVRLDCVNRILVRHWPYVRSYLDSLPEQDDDDGASAGAVTVVGGSAAGSGSNTAVAAGAPPSKNSSPTAGNRSQTSQNAKGAAEDEKQEQSENAAEEELPAGDSSDPQAGGDSEGQDDAEGVEVGSLGNETQPVSHEETGRIPFQQTAEVSIPTGGTEERDETYTGSGYADSARDIERILDDIACEELEQRRTDTMNELAGNIAYGDIHSGVKKTVHRITAVDPDLIEQYNEVAGPLLHISKQLQRSIQHQLQDRRRGGKQTGLYMGRRLDTHALPRRDGRVFYKSSLPNETPELAVGLLVDESGSMSSKDRITYARAASIILYDFCHSLDIPIMVYGHSTGGGVDLYSYAEFDVYKDDDCYRLMDMSARGSNRDGAALRYVAERLVRRPEEVKILILISDGQPADCGYIGTAAEEDLRGIKHEYKRKGVQLIAAAIGDDKENLERIYGDSFMDISDLNKLPVLLTARVKQFIRV